MANLLALMRLRPELREFLRHNLVHRGDILSFRPNLRTGFFTTDANGFRRSAYNGNRLSVQQVVGHQRYGLVLGSSHIFGLGLAGDEHTLPSRLAAHFGFPFANVSLPEGNSRNLYGLLAAFTARVPRPPALVIHFSGGDFTSFTYSSMSDTVFGSPNIKQVPTVLKERGSRPALDDAARQMLAFTTLWTRAIVSRCREKNIPVLLGRDTTFFEKTEPTAAELQSGLGIPANDMQTLWYANHKRVFPTFQKQREELAGRLGVALAGPRPNNMLSFIDEFHYDREGTRVMFQAIAQAVEPLLV